MKLVFISPELVDNGPDEKVPQVDKAICLFFSATSGSKVTRKVFR